MKSALCLDLEGQKHRMEISTSRTCAGYQVRLLHGSSGYLNMNMLIKPIQHRTQIIQC